MKTIYLTFMLLIISATLSLAQQTTTSLTDGPFQWKVKSIDCSFINSSEGVIVKFAFKNISEKNLTIKNVLSSSAFIFPMSYPKTVAPGDSGKIEIKVNPKVVGGMTFNKYVTVYSDDIAGEIKLNIKGDY